MTMFPLSRVALAAALSFGAATAARADNIPTYAPAFGSAVFGGIDTTSCQAPEGSFNFLNNGTSCFSSFAPPPFAANGSLSDSSTGSSASAQADLAQGSLSVAVSGVTGPTPGSAGAHAVVWDTLTFSGAAPGASVTITVSGTSTLSGDARVNAGAILLQSGAFDQTPYAVLEGNDLASVTGSTYSFQETFGILNDVPMLLVVSVDAFAGVSGCSSPSCPPPGSASITDPFTLTLPAGVTFTSASGASSTDVPEPAGLALFGVSLLGLAMIRRRRA